MNHAKLKHKLVSGDFTCIAYDANGLYFSSYNRGIGPLVELCDKNTSRSKLYLADKITGKAAAMLTVECGAKMLYTGVITGDALDVLTIHGVDVVYKTKVAYIKNRDGSGKCPMEQLAKGVLDPNEMYLKAKAFLQGIK